jgi:1-acyl-sn-glycerol-3-phosphate acyltransferase
MVRKRLIILGYILVFWGVLPGILMALAAWGGRVFGPELPLPYLWPVGFLLAGTSGVMLALSIVQYMRASGSLPIGAFPPQRLIRSGVFGIWRHPIYLFYGFFLGGLAMIFWPAGSILIAFPVLALGTFVYAKIEERGLEKRFGRAYNGHRRQTSILIPRLFHLVRPLFAGLSRFFFRLEVAGRENGALDLPFVVISAHRSYLDPIFILLALNVPVHFVTTYEMFRNPISRLIFSKLLCLPERRYQPDVRNALEIRRRLLEGCVVGIFPEAERSWTGTMIGFKPEAVKFLRNLSDIPILPVRLEGTYAAWPRWARGPRRARVTVVIERPVYASRGESSAELEARLSRLVEPREAPDSRLSPLAAGGIESVIYRCPECLSVDAIHSGRGAHFRCSNCLADFTLLSDFSIQRSGDEVRAPLASISRRIRVMTENSLSAPDCCVARAPAKLSVERLGRFAVVDTGRLELSAHHLTFESGGASVLIDLESIRSLVIEGARKLQVFGGRPAGLFQFTLLGQSALKWQDLVVGTIRHRFDFTPSTA